MNKSVQLARASRPANGLHMATRGKPENSPRYREVLAPLGWGDDLCVAVRDGGSCWGFMCLHRERSNPGLTSEDAAFLGRLTPHLAEGLRTALLIANSEVVPESDGPGLLVLKEHRRLPFDGIISTGRLWLAQVQLKPNTTGFALRKVLAAAVF